MLHALTELSKNVCYIKRETEWDEKGEFQSEENKLRSKHPRWNRSSSQHVGEKRQGQCMVTMTASRLTLNSLIIAVVTMTGFKAPFRKPSPVSPVCSGVIWYLSTATSPFPQCPLLHFQLWRSTCFSFSINAVLFTPSCLFKASFAQNIPVDCRIPNCGLHSKLSNWEITGVWTTSLALETNHPGFVSCPFQLLAKKHGANSLTFLSHL